MAMTISTKSASHLLALLFLLLLSHALVSATAHRCHSFSCGQLQDISYPFRRRDDPPQCGDPRYQLNCQGNKSTFFIGSVEYLVTDIRYDHNFTTFRMRFRLVDPNFVDGASCDLPSQSLSASTLISLGKWLNPGLWASFINCSRPIKQHDSRYWPIFCPSCYNSTYVYVIIAEDGFKLKYLPAPCEFISMIPVAEYNQSLSLSSALDALTVLQRGFDLTLSRRIGKMELLLKCLNLYYYSSTIFKRDLLAFGANLLDYCLQACYKYNMPYKVMPLVVTFNRIVLILLALLILSRLIVAPIIIWFLIVYKLWSIKRQEAIDTVEKFLRHQQTMVPTRYAYTDIIAITRHFNEKLGQGGFGSVFKGELAGGILVAVKMMGSSKYNGDEFINEVSTIGRIHHVNVVRLVGYCSEGSHRALVYEYMPSGSLDKYIFSTKKINLHNFTSEKLIDIAMGIARGIDYLHRGCDMQILHFDIKPHNILLDHNFTPKISDFGLAKVYPKNNSLVSISAARGTIGYMAPELISRSFGVISQKSDVYSYGMLLMEMAGRRRNVDPVVKSTSQVYYPSWIYDKLSQQQDLKLDNNFEINGLEKKLAIIGLWCIQMKSFDRPTMIKVIEMLGADAETLPIPPKPFPSSVDSNLETKICLDSFSTELSDFLE